MLTSYILEILAYNAKCHVCRITGLQHEPTLIISLISPTGNLIIVHSLVKRPSQVNFIIAVG